VLKACKSAKTSTPILPPLQYLLILMRKLKGVLCEHHAVCLCVSLSSLFEPTDWFSLRLVRTVYNWNSPRQTFWFYTRTAWKGRASFYGGSDYRILI
jgi:hypothetical protein